MMRSDKGWIQTYTGRQFWPLNPRTEEVYIEDIAHHLSNMCRYTGAVKNFYSVAQHSLLVSDIVAEKHPEFALWALLHDASEAYMHDLPRPLKRAPVFGELYQRYERGLMRVICEHFGLQADEPPCVREADNIALATERRHLLVAPPRPWMDNAEPLHVKPVCMVPWEAEAAFLRAFHRLNSG